MAAVDGYQNAKESSAEGKPQQQQEGTTTTTTNTAKSAEKPVANATATTNSNNSVVNSSKSDSPAATNNTTTTTTTSNKGSDESKQQQPAAAAKESSKTEQPEQTKGPAKGATAEDSKDTNNTSNSTNNTGKQQDADDNKKQQQGGGGEGGANGSSTSTSGSNNATTNNATNTTNNTSTDSTKQQATAGIPGRDDERKLFVGGLTRNTTEAELKEYFGKFGDIESVSIKMDPYTGLSRGFAFMVFQNPKAIDKLLASGDHYINKRKVDPKRVSKKAQHGKIFVGGLTPEITDEDIKNYFGQYGTIVEVQAPFDKTKNQRRSYCFVTFDSKDVVYKLLKTPKQTINGKEVDVKKVKVNQDQRQGFWGPQYGGFGYGGYSYIPDYNGYPGYDDMYNNYEYAGYGYDSMYGIPGKPRPQGPRQFQRHQPY